MKKIYIGITFFTLILGAQEETLDPSIFDGTGRDREEAKPQEPSAGSESQAPPTSGNEPEESAGPPMNSEPQAPLEGEEESEEREIILPGGADTEAEQELEAPGIPAASGGSKSRAGETVNSTEKIVPGQAVDYPWDM